MLVIKPIQDKNTQKAIVEACGGVYLADALAYGAYDCEDDGETVRTLLGACQFSLLADCGSIGFLRAAPGVNDAEALMIMARAAMSFLFRCGYPRAVLEAGAADDALADALNFTPDADGVRAIDLPRFYESPCHYQAEVSGSGR